MLWLFDIFFPFWYISMLFGIYILWLFNVFCVYLVYFVAIWNSLLLFGIYCGYLVYFVVISYMLWLFCIFSTFWCVVHVHKNLATLKLAFEKKKTFFWSRNPVTNIFTLLRFHHILHIHACMHAWEKASYVVATNLKKSNLFVPGLIYFGKTVLQLLFR
jgi:hypothetical protein